MSIPAFVDAFSDNRRFGLELEFFNISQERVESLLSQAGITCWNEDGDESYDDDGNPIAGEGWKITDDGSIDGDWSVELVSPILSGVEGLREVAKVVEILSDAGAKVNKSCGFHVHVDAGDLSSTVLFNVYRRYALHEVQIDSFMVPSRRGNSNAYCQSTVNLVGRTQGVSAALTAREAAQIMEEQYTSHGFRGGRYYKVNLCAYLRHGTIEFRHHGGTVNVNKVLNWIVFCLTFVQTSMSSDTANIFQDLHPDSVQFFNERAASLG